MHPHDRTRWIMRTCDKRLEVRIPEREKSAAEAMADSKGVTVSELMRRALRSYTGLPEPLDEAESTCVAGLRRRINVLEARLNGGDGVGVDAGLAQARADAQALLGR